MTTQQPQVAVYYFPNYHVDPRNEQRYGQGWTEWELVKRATPRFTGHRQPKVPLWGYEDEADALVFEHKIPAAADHAIDCLIFDWYWYDGPFLHRALEQGFMRARNADRLRFSLMWANHNWVELFPAPAHGSPPLLYPGPVSSSTFDQIIDYIVRHYFVHPSYWPVDGCPYFSVYELYRLIEGLGGIDATREALDMFRERTRAAGFPDLHLNAVVWGLQVLPDTQAVTNPVELVTRLGFRSVTSYAYVHHVALPSFPVTPYEHVHAAMRTYWDKAAELYPVPYFPHVSMGWDASPRTEQNVEFANLGYPYMAVLDRNTPDVFKTALMDMRRWIDQQPGHPGIVTVNAWNEWTEGSYLEPDVEHGMRYLEAIRDVFGVRHG